MINPRLILLETRRLGEKPEFLAFTESEPDDSWLLWYPVAFLAVVAISMIIVVLLEGLSNGG